MNSKQASERLAALEHDRAVQVETLDTKARAILDELPKLLSKWIEHEMKQKVASNPANTDKLKGEKLSQMKSEMKALLASLPKYINESAGNSESWPHRNEATLAQMALARYSGGAGDNYWEAIFRKCVNQCGNLLGKYSYMADVSEGSAPWRKVGVAKYAYATGLRIDSAEITSYDAGLAAAVSKWEEIRDTKSLLQRVIATEAWDRA